MEPIYTPRTVKPAYQLNWGLTVFWRRTAVPDGDWLDALQKATAPDGVRVLKHRTTGSGDSQFFISTQPHVAPKELIRSVKGRLQHELRQQAPKAFQRNYCLRSIGAVTREVIEAYVANQERAATKHRHRLSRAAILPDHIHLTLGCDVSESPQDVALGYLNNCAYACGMKQVYRFSYYVGTFGEYDRGAV